MRHEEHKEAAHFSDGCRQGAIDHCRKRDNEKDGHRVVQAGFQHQRILHAVADIALALLDQQEGGGGIGGCHGGAKEQPDKQRHSEHVCCEQADNERRDEHANRGHHDRGIARAADDAAFCLKASREEDDGKGDAAEVEAGLIAVETDAARAIDAEQHAKPEHDEQDGGARLVGEGHQRKGGEHDKAAKKDRQFHQLSFNRVSHCLTVILRDRPTGAYCKQAAKLKKTAAKTAKYGQCPTLFAQTD